MTLYVGGMRCRRCVREVTARMRDVAGVETVTADAGAVGGPADRLMTSDDVLGAFTGTTYRAEVLDDSGRTATGQPGP